MSELYFRIRQKKVIVSSPGEVSTIRESWKPGSVGGNLTKFKAFRNSSVDEYSTYSIKCS